MPSASPQYTFSSVFNEAETPSAATNDNSLTMTDLSNGIASDTAEKKAQRTLDKLGEPTANQGYGSMLNKTYDPFKYLSAMAEQSLTGNFTHCSTTQNMICSSNYNRSHVSASSTTGGTLCENSNTDSNLSMDCSVSGRNTLSGTPHLSSTLAQINHHHYPQCDRSAYSSLSSTSSLSSASPPLSPSSSTLSSCLYPPSTSNNNNCDNSMNNNVSTRLNSTNLLTNDSSESVFCSNQSAPCVLTNDNSESVFCANQSASYDLECRTSPYAQSPGTMTVIGCASPASSSSSTNCEQSSKMTFPSWSTQQVMDESDKLLSWTRQHPENWSSKEVLDWLFFVAQERGLDMQEFRAENFQNITGARLCHMPMEEFINLEPKFGRTFYEMFKKLLCGVTFQEPADSSACPSPCDQMSPYSSPLPFHGPAHPNQAHYQQGYPQLPPPPTYRGAEVESTTDMSSNEVFFKQETYSPNNLNAVGLDISSYDFDLDDTPMIQTSQCHDPYQTEYGVYSTHYPAQATPIRTSCCFPPPPFPVQMPRRRPGRPRVKSLMDDERSCKDKKVKNQHLWEFIYETLMNPLYNPQYLRWENQRDGVFRFVQSEAVAQLWGGRKNNENMTYEKLSRAMRHYYRRGILERVEGRRLVYKFSLKAMERVREKRHNST